MLQDGGAANRCVIAGIQFEIEKLTELLVPDRKKIRAGIPIALVSEGAMFAAGRDIWRVKRRTPTVTRNLAASATSWERRSRSYRQNFNGGKK